MSENDFQKYFYATLFTIDFLTRNGEAFEDLFTSIMKCRYGRDFHLIQPYGTSGDKKTDGYLKSEKTVFQCYAPKQINQSVTLRKISDDYFGAKAFWGDRMERWRFVHNSTKGLPPEVAKSLIDLDFDNATVIKDTMEFDELKDIVVSLEQHHLQGIFGLVPTIETFNNLDLETLRPFVTRISRSEIDTSYPVSTPSENKISVNQFSEETKGLLRIGSLRLPLVRQLFEDEIGPKLGEQIAHSFRARYAKVKKNERKFGRNFCRPSAVCRRNERNCSATMCCISHFVLLFRDM